MLVSIKHEFVLISMPKCASTSTEAALARRSDVRLGSHPKLKHSSLRDYKEYILPLLRFKLGDDVEKWEIISLFRHPIAWLNSWYRFRLREAEAGQPSDLRSFTTGLTFEEFLERYANSLEGPVRFGRQIDRILDVDGNVGKITLFRYEDYDAFLQYLSKKMNQRIEPKKLNVSPTDPTDISAYQHFVDHPKIAADWAVYRTIGVESGISGSATDPIEGRR